MKKISLLLLVLLGNLALISCTEESLADATEDVPGHFADGGDEEYIDPEEEPPGGAGNTP